MQFFLRAGVGSRHKEIVGGWFRAFGGANMTQVPSKPVAHVSGANVEPLGKSGKSSHFRKIQTRFFATILVPFESR